MGEGGVDELNAMKVADLRALLARKGLPTAGKKAELVERLLEAEGPAAASAVSPSEGGVSSAATVEDAQGTGAAAGSSGAAGGVRGNASLAGTVSRATSPALSGRAGGCVASLSGKTNAGGGLQQQQSSANKASGSAGACSPLEMSEEERLAARKCRFGIKTDDEKLLERAKRFNLPSAALEEEKKKLRAERFKLGGVDSSGAAISTDDEAEKRRKRAERFGIVDEEEKKRKRAERFGVLTEEEKMQRRQQRFAATPA